MNIAEIFNKRKIDPQWNTSYPLSPSDWDAYRVNGKLSFDNEKELSLYIHIPFCKQICSFCEYTKMICVDEELQRRYLSVLRKDIHDFKIACNNDLELRGLDIGGGTPSSLSDENFNYLMNIYDETINGIKLKNDFEPSLEATFNTLTEQKIKRMAQSNVLRLSLGIQTSNGDILGWHHRENESLSNMIEKVECAWTHGIRKINVDLMYGLHWQNCNTIKNDLELIKVLNPQQVTLYELRTNMIGYKNQFSKDNLYKQYMQYFEGLIMLGYYGRIGQNTFSKISNDYGVSSYLRSRMLEAVPYKGFGLSAQSMNRKGISYNHGKNITLQKKHVYESSYNEEYTYILPGQELCAKYIAIAAYCGQFSISKLSELLGTDAEIYFKEQLAFCESEKLLVRADDNMFITPYGFKYYGAVFSLFYPSDSCDIIY